MYNYEKLIRILYLITSLSLLVISEICGSEVPRPHGVSLSRAPLYRPDKNFTCFDNSKTIPYSQVNDDFCDCPDASDEPGTSACAEGIFYCVNAGYRPMNIGSDRVNDGICDCCDGSDEYANTNKCINNCVELGRSAREEAMQKEELLKAGRQLREQFSQEGIQRKQQKKEKLLELTKNLEEAKRVKAEKEKLKNEAEELESNALDYYRKLEEEENNQKAQAEALKNKNEALLAFDRYDENKDGKIAFSELQQYQTFDKDKNGEVSEEEAKYFLNDLDEMDSENFCTVAWDRVKPYIMIEEGKFKGTVEPTYDETAEDDAENNEEHADEEKEEEEESEAEAEAQEEEIPATPEEEVPPSKQYDQETRKLMDAANEARNEFADAESSIKELEGEVRNIQKYLDEDFGPDEEYAALHGHCFEYTDYEYTYKLCPFDRTIQQPKSGSMETRLGSWSKWLGPDHNKYESMLYEHGQACWNGPERSTVVKVACGSDNKITSVTEPNKCEYVFEFLTPAACSEVHGEGGDKGHDEL
ncbi:hypothetical protein HHI36_016119 [Cryptolaemus montrouzieri]|uniref:Glucosidase 2 subunit beta n=1 Tax=Cryptolaemus montrouzieri TaxID=559131 RepID=A0ABD2NIR0_9CUCU